MKYYEIEWYTSNGENRWSVGRYINLEHTFQVANGVAAMWEDGNPGGYCFYRIHEVGNRAGETNVVSFYNKTK